MRHRSIVLVPVLLIVIGIGVFSFLKGCHQTNTNYGVIGMPALSLDGKMVVVLVAENDGVTSQVNGGYRKTEYTTTYWLKQYETRTGKFLKKKKVLKTGRLDNREVTCKGVEGNTIWLDIDRVRAFDIASLEETDLKEAWVSGKESGSSASKPNYNKLLHKENYGVRCDTQNKQAFILARSKENAMDTRPGFTDLEGSAYPMQFYSVSYSLEKIGLYNRYTYTSLQKLGETHYFDPCLAVDNYLDQVIRLNDPDGYIIIHQVKTGNESKAVFARVDFQGKKLWETTTDLSPRISYCVFRDGMVAITTNKDNMHSPHLGKDALCILDTRSGAFVKPSLDK